MRLANAVVFLTLSFVALIGYGQQLECGRTKVVYANGVLNEPSDASEGLVALIKAIETYPAIFSNEERSRLDGALAFNPSTNAVVDLIESLDQAGISSETEKWRKLLTEEGLSVSEREAISKKIAATILRGLSESQEQEQLAQALFKHIAKYREWINSGKKVVVVAHSQGNFFANQAYFFLSASEQQAFAIVAVASPDSYVAKSSTPHVTQFGDDVINVRVAQELRNFNYPPPLSPNTPNSRNEGHNFADTYLEVGGESARRIVSYLKSNIDALTNPLCSSNQPPIASFSASVGNANTLTVAVGQQITFDPSASRDPDGQVVGYEWDFGDDSGLSVPGPDLQPHAYSTPGPKTVRLIVTDDRGATTPAEVTISVEAIQANYPPVAAFTATPAAVKVNGIVRLDASASSDPDGTIATYAWDFGDGQTSNPSTPTYNTTYAAPGTYTARLTVTDNEGVTSTVTRDIRVTESDPGVVLYDNPEIIAGCSQFLKQGDQYIVTARRGNGLGGNSTDFGHLLLRVSAAAVCMSLRSTRPFRSTSRSAKYRCLAVAARCASAAHRCALADNLLRH